MWLSLWEFSSAVSEHPDLQSGGSLFELGNIGSLAQLVQSICLTSRGSGVRIPQLPRNEALLVERQVGFFFGDECIVF